MTTQKKTIIVAVAGISVIAIYYLYKTGKLTQWYNSIAANFGSEEITNNKSDTVLYNSTDTSTYTQPSGMKQTVLPIIKGTTSKDILWLQKAMNKLFNSTLTEDGIYGKNTYSAINYKVGTRFFDSYKDGIGGIGTLALYNDLASDLFKKAKEKGVSLT